MDMENDKLDLESVIRREEPAQVDNPVPPLQEKDIEDDGGEENPLSSHEGEDEVDGASREDDQKKMRKRDAKFKEKHPKD